MSKILIIEDNQMVLNLLAKALQKEEFLVTAISDGDQAVKSIQDNNYDLIITDLNLPGKSGLEIIELTKNKLKSNTPILVLSASDEDESIIPALSAGADDYLVKPVTIAQLIVRVKKALGLVNLKSNKNIDEAIINKSRVGIVIPCYNEADRIKKESFQKFLKSNTSYHFLFVNDGSKDHTLKILQDIKDGEEEYISVLDLPVNQGKAEAVRQGIQYLLTEFQLDYVGFLDADLSTDLVDLADMINLMDHEHKTAVVGSRITRVGALIHKESSRAIISKIINKLIQSIIQLPFRDTQCGAKLFNAELSKTLFTEPFLSRWLFDVEIFIRLREMLGKDKANSEILEYPLKRWIHMDGSKLGFKDSLKIFSELIRINNHYKKKN